MLFRDYTLEMFGKTLDPRWWVCQDGRDREYAIMGFKALNSSINIALDYKLDARHIYIQFAREHVLNERAHDTDACWIGGRRRQGIRRTAESYSDRISDPDDYCDDESILGNLGLPS
jgi:hypothetical protein